MRLKHLIRERRQEEEYEPQRRTRARKEEEKGGNALFLPFARLIPPSRFLHTGILGLRYEV
jgi:hypothetical protein